jgi:LacI family transcriptional regulator
VEGASFLIPVAECPMPAILKERRRPRVGLKQIAAEAGVSLMTVSRALKGEGRLSAETRERVKDVARRLRYRPNRLVRAIQTGRSGTVGVMVNLSRSFTALLVRGIHNELASHGSLPLLHFRGVNTGTAPDPIELDHIHRLLDQRVDGIIVWPSDETVADSYLREVWERGIPLVAVDRRLDKTRADFSGTDDVTGGRLAAEHLLSLGHRRILHLSGDLRVSTFADRLRGFRMAVGARRAIDLQTVECGLDDCRDRVIELLDAPHLPTAIACASDLLAQQVYEALEQLGLQAGRDVSVVGFADLPESQWLQPKLTTVRQDFEQIGRNAARLILERFNAGAEANVAARSLRVTPELVVRGSTAPPSPKHQ